MEDKLVLYGLQMQVECGNVDYKKRPENKTGWFGSKGITVHQLEIDMFDAHFNNTDKTPLECKTEYIKEWSRIKCQYSKEMGTRFEEGDQVVNHEIGETGYVVECGPSVMMIMLGGQMTPVPRIVDNYEVADHRAKEPAFAEGQTVRVRNHGEDWLEAKVVSLKPLKCRPEDFQNEWTWDQVAPITEKPEAFKVRDEVKIISGMHEGKDGVIDRWSCAFGEWEVKLQDESTVLVEAHQLEKKRNLQAGDFVRLLEGEFRGAIAQTERWSEAWGEWEVRLPPPERKFCFVKRDDLEFVEKPAEEEMESTNETPQAAAKSRWSLFG